MNSGPAQVTPNEPIAFLGLQPAGAFLAQRQERQQHHAHSPPMTIPPPQRLAPASFDAFTQSDNGVRSRTASTTMDPLPVRDTGASASFLAAIRRGLHDQSSSWDNGWFIGDDSDEDDDDDDQDFYSSMYYPYASDTSYPGGCAPAGSFAQFATSESNVPAYSQFDITTNASGPLRRESSLIFAMEV